MSTPGPADFADQAVWIVWTDLVVPALGVLASTLVAVVALVVSSRARRSADAQVSRAERVDHAALLSALVQRRRLAEGPNDLDVIRAAESLDPPAPELAEWWIRWRTEIMGLPLPSDDRLRIRAAVAHEFQRRVTVWIRDGRFDASAPEHPELK